VSIRCSINGPVLSFSCRMAEPGVACIGELKTSCIASDNFITWGSGIRMPPLLIKLSEAIQLYDMGQWDSMTLVHK
jgi:hypothetical protein